MNDQDLRALVRDAVDRHLGRGERQAPGHAPRAPAVEGHPSHYLYVTVVNAGDACVIEPSVSCSHCGYCKSHGH